MRLRILACAALAGAALSIAPEAARADHGYTGDLSYCGVVIDPYTWCGRNDIRHTYSVNSASYPGSGNVWTCERMIGANSGSLYTQSCYWNYTWSCLYSGCHDYDSILLEAEVSQRDNSRHTVNGYAKY
jgi:hypothetical protein